MAIISNKLIKLLNYRIQQEELSSRLYKAMGVWLEFNGYFGAAGLWYRYSEEEKTHSEWAYSYLLDLNIKPIVPELDQPQLSFSSLPEIIEYSYKHEVEITRQCEVLAKSSQEEGSFMTLELAQRYLKEQVEELNKTKNWMDRLEAFGRDKVALRLLDNEMKGQVK